MRIRCFPSGCGSRSGPTGQDLCHVNPSSCSPVAPGTASVRPDRPRYRGSERVLARRGVCETDQVAAQTPRSQPQKVNYPWTTRLPSGLGRRLGDDAVVGLVVHRVDRLGDFFSTMLR